MQIKDAPIHVAFASIVNLTIVGRVVVWRLLTVTVVKLWVAIRGIFTCDMNKVGFSLFIYLIWSLSLFCFTFVLFVILRVLQLVSVPYWKTLTTEGPKEDPHKIYHVSSASRVKLTFTTSPIISYQEIFNSSH